MSLPRERWARAYLVGWVAWMAVLASVAAQDVSGMQPWWWGLGAAFVTLEGLGMARRGDRLPMLTEVLGRYIPGFVLFPVSGLAVWRLSYLIPGWLLFPFACWLFWHWIITLHDYAKMGGKDTRLR